MPTEPSWLDELRGELLMKSIVVSFQHHAELFAGDRVAEHQITVFIALQETVLDTPVNSVHRPVGRIIVDSGLSFLLQQRLHISTEGVHALTVLWEPVHHIAVVGCDTLFTALGVADNVLLSETILLAEVGTKLGGLTVHLLEIGAVREAVLADFKTDMGVVGATTGVPSTVIPR